VNEGRVLYIRQTVLLLFDKSDKYAPALRGCSISQMAICLCSEGRKKVYFTIRILRLKWIAFFPRRACFT